MNTRRTLGIGMAQEGLGEFAAAALTYRSLLGRGAVQAARRLAKLYDEAGQFDDLPHWVQGHDRGKLVQQISTLRQWGTQRRVAKLLAVLEESQSTGGQPYKAHARWQCWRKVAAAEVLAKLGDGILPALNDNSTLGRYGAGWRIYVLGLMRTAKSRANLEAMLPRSRSVWVKNNIHYALRVHANENLAERDGTGGELSEWFHRTTRPAPGSLPSLREGSFGKFDVFLLAVALVSAIAAVLLALASARANRGGADTKSFGRVGS